MKELRQHRTSHVWEWKQTAGGEISVTAGCFSGTLNELVERVNDNHNTKRIANLLEGLDYFGLHYSIIGYGSGSGYGDGSGDGDGYGYGYGYGYGDGYGDGKISICLIN